MKQKFFKFLADLRFAIFILLLISFCSIIGTVIEQDQSIEIYKIQLSIKIQFLEFYLGIKLLQFGLDHIYKTWWFFMTYFFFGS